jgi:diguanylate cyclase (GGDEF)-like protein
MYEQLDINILSLLVMVVVLVSHIRNSHDSLLRQRYFRSMIISNIIILALDTAIIIVGGKPGAFALVFHTALWSFYLFFCVVFCLMWAMFCTMRRGHKVKSYELLLLCLPLVIYFGFLLLNLGHDILFTLSPVNVFVRGRFFHITSVCAYSYVAYSVMQLWRHKKNMSKNEIGPYLLLPLLPMAAGIVALAVDAQVPIVWPSVTFALLAMQLFMLGEKANLDHLTGLYNRKYLDDYVEDMLQTSRVGYARSNRNFAALMLDIDGFKMINDSFGHVEGDRAITASASLLKKSVRKGDFVARYGGDEFLVILDQCSTNTPKRVIKRIRENLSRFNNNNTKPYQLEVSIGYKVFSDIEGLTAKDVFTSIDELMYENKQSKASGKKGSGQPGHFEYNRTQQ